MIGDPAERGPARSSRFSCASSSSLASGRRTSVDPRRTARSSAPFPRRARPRGRRGHDGRRRAGRAGRARWSSSPASPFPVRYGRLARRRPAGRGGRRHLCDRDICRRELRVLGSRTPARRQARLRPRLRARAALRALRRDARGVPAAGTGAGRGAEAGSNAGAAPRRAIVVPSAYLAEIADDLGARPRARLGAAEPGPGGRRRCSSLAPGTFVFVGRLTRAEGPRGRDRGDRAGARRHG